MATSEWRLATRADLGHTHTERCVCGRRVSPEAHYEAHRLPARHNPAGVTHLCEGCLSRLLRDPATDWGEVYAALGAPAALVVEMRQKDRDRQLHIRPDRRRPE